VNPDHAVQEQSAAPQVSRASGEGKDLAGAFEEWNIEG
jgi:hypothetical protein